MCLFRFASAPGFWYFHSLQARIDAIGTKRFDSQTGADREVQRILLELLNQMAARHWKSIPFDNETRREDVSFQQWIVLHSLTSDHFWLVNVDSGKPEH